MNERIKELIAQATTNEMWKKDYQSVCAYLMGMAGGCYS